MLVHLTRAKVEKIARLAEAANRARTEFLKKKNIGQKVSGDRIIGAGDLSLKHLHDAKREPNKVELERAIDSLSKDELMELMALMWVGRGNYDRGTWQVALDHAKKTSNSESSRYVSGKSPVLAKYLERGLAALGE